MVAGHFEAPFHDWRQTNFNEREDRIDRYFFFAQKEAIIRAVVR